MNISNREKNILIAGAIFIVLFFGYQLAISPVFEKRQHLNRQMIEKSQGLEEMNTLRDSYLSVSSQMDSQTLALTTRAKNFSLFSFIDLQAQQSGVKENVDYMKPFTKKQDNADYMVATVKIKLKEVYLKEFIDFLKRIESSKNGVTITSLSLTKAGKSKKQLDAVLEAQTLMRRGGA